MEMSNGIMPVYNMDNNRGLFGDDGMVWVLFLLLLGGGRGLGFGGQDVNVNDEFIKRDLFNINQNVSAQGAANQSSILESQYQTALAFKDQLYAQQECCCKTNQNIDAIRAEAYRNTCEITNTMRDGFARMEGLFTAQAIQDLRDRLADRDRDLQTANFQLSQQAQSQYILGQIGKYGLNQAVWSCGFNPCCY